MPKKKTSSKKTAKSSKKTKIEAPGPFKVGGKEMVQTHAKEEKFEPTTLDQVWGDTGNTKYGTTDEATYLNKVSEMNKSDLMAHAHLHGLVPIPDRGRLTKLLMSEFRKYVSGFQKPAPPTKTPQEISDEVAKILAEGR